MAFGGGPGSIGCVAVGTIGRLSSRVLAVGKKPFSLYSGSVVVV